MPAHVRALCIEHYRAGLAGQPGRFEYVYPKLGVSDKAAAVAAALRHGLID